MTDQEFLTTRFEEQRIRLEGVARRMLGSRSEAEDAVQDVWLRLNGTDADAIDNLGGWLTTVTARVCLNRLRSRGAHPEDPVERVPDPVISRAGTADPALEAELADSVGLALHVVIETLPPAERLAFVLHDLFGVPVDEIAPIPARPPARPPPPRAPPAREPRATPGAGRAGARRRRLASARGGRRVLRRGAR